ncbi:MAG: hypothetical protein ACM3VS_16130 [Candidatus Dadabacteria bacterium]
MRILTAYHPSSGVFFQVCETVASNATKWRVKQKTHVEHGSIRYLIKRMSL